MNPRVAILLGLSLSLTSAPLRAEPLCDDPLSAQGLADAIDDGRTAFFLMETDRALASLEATEDRLSCGSAPLDASALSLFYQHLGAVYLASEQLPEATRALGQAARLSTDLAWDPALENRARGIFLEEKAAQLTGPMGTLKIGRDPSFQDVHFNGQRLKPGQALTGISPGEYFVQRELKDAEVWGTWVTLEGTGPWALFLVSGGVTAEPLPEAGKATSDTPSEDAALFPMGTAGGPKPWDNPNFRLMVAAMGGAMISGTLFTTLEIEYRAGVFDNTQPAYPALKRTRAAAGILTLGCVGTAVSAGVTIRGERKAAGQPVIRILPGSVALSLRF